MTVSVIIPTYNYAHYIAEAIESVWRQRTEELAIEIIVVDDGSTDSTEEVVKALEIPTIKYFKQGNQGKAHATHRAITEASGKYIFNLDADDFFFPGKLRRSVEIFESDGRIVHVANAATFLIDGKVTGKETFPSEIADKVCSGIDVLSFFYSNRLLFGGGSTFSARADVLKSIAIPADVDMYIDEYLVLTTLARGYCYFTNESFSVWRGHSTNYTYKTPLQDAKTKRLLRSSAGILKALQTNLLYPTAIRRLYGLHHQTRSLFLKEVIEEKSLRDIIGFFAFCFLDNKFSLKELRTYNALPRFLPLFLLSILKKIKR